MQRPPSTETLVSSLNKFERYNALPGHNAHPFDAKAGDSIASLRDLIDTANSLSNALDVYSLVSWSNPKLISLLRQNSNISQTLQTSENNSHHIIAAFRQRAGISYGESIPLEPTNIPEWCISRLESWCKFAGLETFKDDNREGDATTIVLGGKVLVIDIDFTFNRSNPRHPTVNVSRLKTSYAIGTHSSGSSNASGSSSLDTFLTNVIQRFCTEAQKRDDLRDPQKASQLGKDVLQQFQYLVMLDQLAQRQGDDGGLRWFTGIDKNFPMLESFSANEARAVGLSLSLPKVPLDIFLHRSHALAIPHLVSPSISFLVYISPTAYHSLLRNTVSSAKTDEKCSPLDINARQLQSHLSGSMEGTTIATLMLNAIPYPSPRTPSSATTLASRPIFHVVSAGGILDDPFPHLSESVNPVNTESGQYEWVLDFTAGGKNPGVVMSRSRMRELELILDPFANSINMDTLPDGGSWVDLLLASGRTAAAEFYIATYISPTSSHPPLQLRLTAPSEQGFFLEHVPVHSMKEVWGVLEVVREQSWLNEILKSCQWANEGSSFDDTQNDEVDATEAELHTILSGTFVPRLLPVNLFVDPRPKDDPISDIFGPIPGTDKPKIVMESPERSPITGLVKITVTFDELKPRGVCIDIDGAVGADIRLDLLEEESRQGGTLGLPGSLWSRSHHSLQI